MDRNAKRIASRFPGTRSVESVSRRAPIFERKETVSDMRKMTLEEKTGVNESFKSFLKGKKAVLVGPAGYLEGQGKGSWIDEFDVVVRINYSIMNDNYEDYGQRTDVLYNCLADDPHGGVDMVSEDITNSTIESLVKYVVTTIASSACLAKYRSNIKGKLEHLILDRSFFDHIKKDMVNAPNTGVVAIKHLLSMGLQSLNVVGFDFYFGKYQKGYLNKKGSNDKVHNNFSQIIYLDLLAKQENRLKLDSMLEHVISETKKRVSIVIPFKSDDLHRKQLLEFIVNRYKNILPETEVIVAGDGKQDGWSKAKASNNGVKRAKGDIVMIVDADIIIPLNSLLQMIKFSVGEKVVFLQGKKRDITQRSTKDVLTNSVDFLDTSHEKEMVWNKAIFCMTKDKFLNCKGFDERFEGWGGEELAFYQILNIYYGAPRFINCDIYYHLWHEVQSTKTDYKNNIQNANKRMLNKYKRARTISDLKRIRDEQDYNILS